MNRVAVACVGLLALAGGSAVAADLAPYYQPGPAYNPIYTWTGFYVGINGGGGWGSSQWDAVNSFDVSGGLIGGTVGYNWQFGQVVVGAEGDIDWSGIKGTTTVLCPGGCETRNKWLATARGRLGYAFDRFLPYFTGGLAFGDINATLPLLPVVSNVSLKAEYLYVDLGNFNCGLNCGLAPGSNVSFTTNVFRGGANLRF